MERQNDRTIIIMTSKDKMGQEAGSHSESRVTPADLPFRPEKGEEKGAFDAFLEFARMGKARRLARVAAKLGVSRSSVTRWAARFKWSERLRAYNEEMLRSQVEAEKKGWKDAPIQWEKREAIWRDKEWQTAVKLHEKAMRHMMALDRVEPGEVSMGEVVRALELCSKLARLGIGMATEKQEHTGAVQIDIEAALDRIYGKPIPGEVIDVQQTTKAIAAP